MKPTQHIRAEVSIDGVVFMDAKHGIILGANAVAARIWAQLLAGATESEIAAQITEQWKVAPAMAERDVAEFVRALLDRKIIERT